MGRRWQAISRGVTFLDTTVKSGAQMFAPTWEMVLGIKGGDITEEEYTQMYRAKMNESWKRDRVKWMALIEGDDPIAIGCYCKPGEFCHRHLLKDIFEKICAAKGLPFYYYGELT